jgi:hypothetical protein
MITRSYALVPDARGERLLLLRGADGWEIPHLDTTEPRWWHVVGDLNCGLGELLGLDLTTLRCLANVSVDDRLRVRFYELESHGADGSGPGGAWVDRTDLARIDLAEPEHRSVLLRCLDERSDDGGPLHIPWARPGWFSAAAGWIRDRLDELGLDAVAVVQERTWSISTVLRASTREGDLYLKAVGRMFAGEPALTRELGRRHPGSVPAVAALDEERGWMLMHDFGGEELSAETDASALEQALRSYAGMQCSWLDRGGELTRLGCPDRTLAVLEARIDPLLGDLERLLPGHPDGLSETELAAVPALAERLHADCERLRAHELPPTLEHGDLHTNNVRAQDGRFLFFDWSDACLSVPFFSLVPFLDFHDEPLAPSLRARLRDAYLEPWAERLPGTRLVEAFELAQVLGLFHQAISYHRLAEQTEPRARWEWARGFPYFVKRLLERAARP